MEILQGVHTNTIEDAYRLKFYAVFDTIISCIQNDDEMFSTLEQIVLEAANGKQCEDETDKDVSFYKYYFDLEILKV